MPGYSPGMRVMIRDEEWVIRKVERNDLDRQSLHCIGISPLVKGRDAIFLEDLEEVIPVAPEDSRGFQENQWGQKLPTDSDTLKRDVEYCTHGIDESRGAAQRSASRISQDLKFALRECVELLGGEVLYDMAHRLGRDLERDPVDPEELTDQCMRYMYRMLFVLFIEARRELGFAPMKVQAYAKSYSLESLRDLADALREEDSAVEEGFYVHETLSKLFRLIYEGYPGGAEELNALLDAGPLNDAFIIPPLAARVFDPESTPMLQSARLRNKAMLRIVRLMSGTRPTGRGKGRRSRISYANLGINQLGAAYEALLSYRGFIAQDALYEVKRRQDGSNQLDAGYFVTEDMLAGYHEEERVRYTSGEKRGQLCRYEKGEFIYRLAGRGREKSASYYTPEALARCLVKYALKELLEGRTADQILDLKLCEPAMGSAAFLNEAVNQLAEAYLDRKQRELGE